MLTLDILTT